MAEGEVIKELENVGTRRAALLDVALPDVAFPGVVFPLQLRGTPRPYISPNNDYQELKNWRIEE